MSTDHLSWSTILNSENKINAHSTYYMSWFKQNKMKIAFIHEDQTYTLIFQPARVRGMIWRHFQGLNSHGP